MNINSPVFVPQPGMGNGHPHRHHHNMSLASSPPSPLSCSPPAKTPNLGKNFTHWPLFGNIHANLNYYQQQQQQQQQHHYYSQRNFFNSNYPQQPQQWFNMQHQQQHQQQHHQQQRLQNAQKKHFQKSNKFKAQKPHINGNSSNNNSMGTISTIPNNNNNNAINTKNPKSTTTNNTKIKPKPTAKTISENAVDSSKTTTAATPDAESTETLEVTKEQKQQEKNDTMQRNGSKASQTTKSHKDSHNHPNHHHHHHTHSQQQQHLKHDSSDSGISNHHGKSSRKSRSSAKRQDAAASNAHHHHQHTTNNNGPTTQQTTKCTTAYSVDEWLDNDAMYCYDGRFMSSCAEDQHLTPRHNPAHRNSTSSDAAASDDLNSSSSNEDLSAAAYTVLSKVQNKKNVSKSRQRRQQKRKQANANAMTTSPNSAEPMDIDLEGKENQVPHQTQVPKAVHSNSNNNNNSSNNLRKQCTKAAALKAVNAQIKSSPAGSTSALASSNTTKSNGKSLNRANALSTSASNSSVCSSLSGNSSLSCSSLGLCSSSSANSSPNNSAQSSPTASPTASKRKADTYKKIARALAPPLRQHTKLNLSESELVQQLRRYIIDANLLRVYGYPVESAIHEGCIEVYKCLPKPFNSYHHPAQNHSSSSHAHLQTPKSSSNVINTNDGLNFSSISLTASSLTTAEGAASLWSSITLTADTVSLGSDSGQGSGESSPPSVDSDSSEVGEDENGTTACYTPDGSYQIFSQYDQSLEKQCVRCMSAFHVTESGEYLNREQCTFHWGKLNHMYTGKGFGYSYSCCEGDQSSEGCSRNSYHVWTGAVVGLNGPYTDFVHTRPNYSEEPKPTKVYALDCEMSFTGRGLEVTKVTVVGYDGQLVYEHFVRPDAEIVDYNTRFSGITERDLSNKNSSVKTLSQVQRDLIQLFDGDTILIGHGLDNDLRVLRMVHKTIIDTSITFPHASGFPYRRALKHLTKVCLNRDIQCSDAGHSSFEDSRACLELMLWKVRKDMRQQSDHLTQY